MKTELYIEAYGRQVLHTDIIEAAKERWKAGGNKVKDLNQMSIYYKPEENKCYYIFNNDASGSFEV